MERKAWPYLAGIIDSEGSILIGAVNGGFYSKIKIANTDKRLMRWLVQNFGNSYTSYLDERGNRKRSYIWQCGAAQQEALLLGVLPYLLVKKNQALACLDFRRALSQDEKKTLHLTMRDLNQRIVVKDVLFTVDRSKDAYKYAAGYMDGDGCFSFQSDGHGRIQVVSIDFIIIKWLLANFGGKFYTYKEKGNASEHFRWFLNGGKNKERFLLGVLPYLVLKRQQAKAFLEIVRLRQQDPYNKDKTVNSLIVDLRQQISELNSPVV